MSEILSDFQSRAKRDMLFSAFRHAANTQVRYLLFVEELDLKSYKSDVGRGELFDSSRESMNKAVSNLFNLLPDVTAEETQNMMRFGREIYSFVITRFLEKSLSTKDQEFRQSLKGITWSIMAKDIDKTLCPWGQSPLSPEWKERMRGLIFSKVLDTKAVGVELKRFESGGDGCLQLRST